MNINCEKICALISDGRDEHLREGMQLLYEEVELRKVAKYYHSRYYSLLNSFLSWEDLLYETIVRTTNEIQEGRGPKKNCKGYLRNVCRNVCEEYRRENQRSEATILMLTRIIKTSENAVIRERVEACLKKIGGQCGLLLELIYLEDPPITDNAKLADALKDYGYKTKANVIPAVKTRCKRKFRDLLKGDPSSLFEE